MKVPLSLSFIFTFSEKKDGEYVQHFSNDDVVEGVMEYDVLNNIIELNFYLLKALFKRKYNTNVDLNLNSLFSNIAEMASVYGSEISVFTRKLHTWITSMVPDILKNIQESSIDEYVDSFKRFHTEENFDAREKIIDDAMAAKDYTSVVKELMYYNRCVYPFFPLNLLLCVVSELYIVFLDINEKSLENKIQETGGDEKKKDILVLQVLYGVLQRNIYDNSSYEMGLMDYMKKNHLEDKNNNLELSVFKYLKSRRVMQNMFQVLSLKTYKPKIENIVKYYDMWDGQSDLQKMTLYTSLRLAKQGIRDSGKFMLIPYIMGVNLNRIDRIFIDSKYFLKKLAKSDHDAGLLLSNIIQDYEKIFNHIVWPNPDDTINVNGRIINTNIFHMGDRSLMNILLNNVSKENLDSAQNLISKLHKQSK